MRAFIGIDFENKLRKEISDLQQRLRGYAVRGRWKHSDNFHLTLSFLDEISIGQKDQIDRVMKEMCNFVKPLSLALSGIGSFEGGSEIRVLWLGLSGDIRDLQSLYGEIGNSLASIGFPKEKRSFKPHITLGQDIVFKCGLEELRRTVGEARFAPFEAKSLFLFKSEQVQNKRIYTKISEYVFGKADRGRLQGSSINNI